MNKIKPDPLLTIHSDYTIEFARRNGKSFSDMCKLIEEYNKRIVDRFYLGMSYKAWNEMLEMSKLETFKEDNYYVGSI